MKCRLMNSKWISVKNGYLDGVAFQAAPTNGVRTPPRVGGTSIPMFLSGPPVEGGDGDLHWDEIKEIIELVKKLMGG